MAHPRLSEPARVTIGLKVTEADAARIDQVLERPEFAGWTRSEWCREIIRTALRYYARRPSLPDPGQAGVPGRPAAPQPASPVQSPPPPAARSPAPAPGASGPAGRPGVSDSGPPAPAAPEPWAQPECAHPPAARDYQTGTCAACGAILWD